MYLDLDIKDNINDVLDLISWLGLFYTIKNGTITVESADLHENLIFLKQQERT